MSYDPDDRLLLTPIDREAAARMVRLRELGIGDIPDAEFDAFAKELAEKTGAPFAFVNFIDENRQYFAGLHTPASGSETDPDDDSGRTMTRDYGYCVHVVARKRALVLEDLRDFPRFHGNPVVDELGFQSYLGAPLIDANGMVLGTIAVTDTEPRRWGQPGLKLIKSLAAEMMERIRRREPSSPE